MLIAVDWRGLAEHNRKLEENAEIIQDRQRQRIMADSLRNWMLRVVELRDREMQVNQLYQARLLRCATWCNDVYPDTDPHESDRSALSKWMDGHSQQLDRLSLMQSFVDIKQQGAVSPSTSTAPPVNPAD